MKMTKTLIFLSIAALTHGLYAMDPSDDYVATRLASLPSLDSWQMDMLKNALRATASDASVPDPKTLENTSFLLATVYKDTENKTKELDAKLRVLQELNAPFHNAGHLSNDVLRKRMIERFKSDYDMAFDSAAQSFVEFLTVHKLVRQAIEESYNNELKKEMPTMVTRGTVPDC